MSDERDLKSHQIMELSRAIERVTAEVDTWGDASREWYYANRYASGGTTYACGFEDGWAHAEQLLRAAIAGPQ